MKKKPDARMTFQASKVYHYYYYYYYYYYYHYHYYYYYYYYYCYIIFLLFHFISKLNDRRWLLFTRLMCRATIVQNKLLHI